MHAIGGHPQERQKTTPIQFLPGKHFPCADIQGCSTRLFRLRHLFHLQGCKRCQYTRGQIQGWIPLLNLSPPPRVAPETKRPIVHEPVTKRTRSNTAPIYNPIAIRTRVQTKKALTVMPAQEARSYYPQALLALFCMPIQEMEMPVLYA